MPDRKPFAKSFLSGMKPQCFSRVGNSLQIVSRPAGDKGFPLSRKPFVKSFLFGMKQPRSNTIGNLSRIEP